MPRETGWRLYECLALPTRFLFELHRSATYFHCQYNVFQLLPLKIVDNDHW
jgi:hypothetical protein